MLGVFSGAVASPPEELVAAGSRSPSPKTTASDLVARFLEAAAPAMSVRIGGRDGDGGHLAYSHPDESTFNARYSHNPHRTTASPLDNQIWF